MIESKPQIPMPRDTPGTPHTHHPLLCLPSEGRCDQRFYVSENLEGWIYGFSYLLRRQLFNYSDPNTQIGIRNNRMAIVKRQEKQKLPGDIAVKYPIMSKRRYWSCQKCMELTRSRNIILAQILLNAQLYTLSSV